MKKRGWKNIIIDQMLKKGLDDEIANPNRETLAEIMAERDGHDLKIGFTPKFLLDILRVIDDENVTLYMNNSKTPCFLRANDDSYVYMLLPVNIGAH